MTPGPPAIIDITTQSSTGSLEYAYRGAFENAFRIYGGSIERTDGWIRAGLYLSGDYGHRNPIFVEVTQSPYQFDREIINSGTINGREFSIFSDSAIGILIRNTGEFDGDVVLGDGLDQIINHGKIDGTVTTGASGTYYSFSTANLERDLIENHGVIRGSVTLGDGDDVFTSFGNARVGSKKKPAAVMGMDGDDTLTGADQADKLLGGKGQDRLIGGKGDDRLFGNRDDDILRGGAGDDLLVGGLGKDWMFGGAGSDVFRLHAVDASERGNRADRIADFDSGTDRIDLTSVAENLFFIGTDAFTGSGRAELCYDVGQNGAARVLVDADGDGRSDMRINLIDTPVLSETDFIF